MGNLLAGEIFCEPVEDGTNGLLVCDGVVSNVGPVTKPVSMHVKEGRLDRIESDDLDLSSPLATMRKCPEVRTGPKSTATIFSIHRPCLSPTEMANNEF
jgi:hypothetical protein